MITFHYCNHCNINYVSALYIVLIHAGATFTKDKQGVTTLMKACFSGNFEIVKLIAENKFEMNAINNEGWSAIHYCAKSINGTDEIIRYLNQTKGADVSIPCLQYNDTPLHIAATEDRPQILKCLIKECGANVNARNKLGETPLMKAITR